GDPDAPRLLGQFDGVALGVVVARKLRLDDLRAEAADRLFLVLGDRLRHADGAVDAVVLRGPGETLAVVAGAGAEHARQALLLRQPREARQSSADLERARVLEILALEPDLRFARLAQPFRG